MVKNYSFNLIYFLTYLIFFSSCQNTSPSPQSTTTHIGFYHWQTNFELSPKESQFINALSIERCYIKFFDVDWDFQRQEAIPHASLEVSTTLPATIQIVPTVFITNRTFQHISKMAIEELSERVAEKILQQSNHCLLYTSPSPRDATLSRMPSSA